jgi:outer membrane lipoprotein-sorting protein
MKKLPLFLILSLLVLPSWSTFAAPQTADEIIEKHLAALGGREALGKITSRKSTGTITVSVEQGDMSGPVETYAKAPNLSRALIHLDLSAMGMSDTMTIDQRFDGTSGVATNSLQGSMPIEGDQLNSMRNNVFPTALLSYKEHGTTISLLPKETIGGKELIVLNLVPKVGQPSKVYFDPVTYLTVRSVSQVTLPDVGQFEQISEASDHRAVDGVQVPFTVVNTSPMQTVTIKLKTVEHNVTIDDAMFSVK